jgi:beta-lactam-binding protein with PASTA domain
MGRSFAITTPANALDLAGKSSGDVTLTVTNQTERALRGTARLVPIDPTRKEWIRIVDGEEERAFAPKGTHQYKVRAEIPKDTPKGSYTFRMDFVSSENPDEDSTPGPAIALKVADAAPATGGRFPMWIIPVIAVVLIGAGLGLFFALRGGGGVDVPDLKGKTVDEAGAALTAAGFTSEMGDPKEAAGATPGTVVEQSPAAGEKAPKGSSVKIHPQAAPAPADTVAVPAVTGKSLDSAKVLLYEAGFSVKLGAAKFTGGAPGLIVGQTPAGGSKAPRGAVVELHPEKESILVPSVMSKPVTDAVVALKHAKLDWEPIEEASATAVAGTVLKQSPAPGARAEQDSVVKLTIAKTPGRPIVVKPWATLELADMRKLAVFAVMDPDIVSVSGLSSEGSFSGGNGPLVTVSYQTQQGGAARVEVTPFSGGKVSPGGSAVAAPTAKEGKGEAKLSVRVYGTAVVKVDELLVRLVGPKGEELHSVRKPVSLTFHPIQALKERRPIDAIRKIQ